MPARKRHRREPHPTDPVARFGRSLLDEAERERAEQRRIQAERTEANHRRRLAEERARAIADATARVERAIDAAKEARRRGTGIQEADDEWKAAKTALIELETGEAPDW